MSVKVKQWYVSFLERDKKNILEVILNALLYFLSLIYGLGVLIRNFFYDKGIFKIQTTKAKVISIGNLSWSGTGKTSLSIWLYKKLTASFKTAILRRGYGDDEAKLIAQTTKDVFSSLNRAKLAKDLEKSFDLFILDDGFQYRRLRRNLNIVVMGAREFRRKYGLIPVNFFREPMRSLLRADILLLNYSEEIEDISKIKESILKEAGHLGVYTCGYRVRRFCDLEGGEISIESLRQRPVAALAAIGYPHGFFNKLKELDFNLGCQIIYPDHHELSQVEFDRLETDLLKKGIKDLVITQKDKYHFPTNETKLNIVVMEVDIEIDNEAYFLGKVKAYLK